MYLIGLALAAVATFPVLSAAEDALCDTFQSYTTWPYICQQMPFILLWV
jgi:hypothetical protein